MIKHISTSSRLLRRSGKSWMNTIFLFATLVSVLYICSELFLKMSPKSEVKDVIEKGSSIQASLKMGEGDDSVINEVKQSEVKCTDFRSPLTDDDDEFTTRIKTRIIKAEEICKNASRVKFEFKELDHIAKRIVVDEEHKAIQTPIPKAGSTYWKIIFSHIHLPEYQDVPHSELLKRISLTPERQRLLVYLDAFEPEQRLKMIDDYYTFIFVREPFRRLLSAYRNKFQHAQETYHLRRIFGEILAEIESKMTGKPPAQTTAAVNGKTYSFRSFMRYLSTTDPAKYNGHWGLYIDRALPCVMKYDFIGTLETMHEDYDYLSKCRFHEGTYEEINPGKDGPTSDVLFNDFYASVDDEDIVKVYELFLREYRCFDYPMPHIVAKAKSRLR